MNKAVYSSQYFPPAPIIPVHIGTADSSGRMGPFDALVDTGADGTFVPISILEALEVPVAYSLHVRSHLSSSPQRMPVFTVDIVLFGSILLPSIDVVGDPRGDSVIVGRNVLNLGHVYLAGPKQTIEVSA
ncbi:hypothetical protein GC175_12085 [bacterium]|nr:hypothetical protein [bacterium]